MLWPMAGSPMNEPTRFDSPAWAAATTIGGLQKFGDYWS